MNAWKVLMATVAAIALSWSAVALDKEAIRADLEALKAAAREPNLPAGQVVSIHLAAAELARSLDDKLAEILALESALAGLDGLSESDAAQLPPRALLLEQLAGARANLDTLEGQVAAMARVRESEKAWEELLGVDSPALGEARLRLAAIARTANDPRAAVQLTERANAIKPVTRSLEAKSAADRGIGPSADGSGFSQVPVFYATTREVKNVSGRALRVSDFTSDKAAPSYGRVIVTVPDDHTVGEIERPTIWSFEIGEDKKKHVTIDNIRAYDSEAKFVSEVRKHLDGAGDPSRASVRREVLVFIHGYNQTFERAVMSAGVLAYDLRLDGAPILYSWPSRGNFLSYTQDANRCSDDEARMLARFLDRVARETGADRVQVVAHSRGNCLLLQGLNKIATGEECANPRTAPDGAQLCDRPETKLFDDVVLAAPDVDRGDFTDARARLMGRMVDRITIYASAKDFALKASRLVGGAPRLGDITPPYTVKGTEVVDATNAPSDLFGHMHFASGAIDDLRALLWAGATASHRCVIDASASPFRFDQDRCDHAAMRAAAYGIRKWKSNAKRILCDNTATAPDLGAPKAAVCAQVKLLTEG